MGSESVARGKRSTMNGSGFLSTETAPLEAPIRCQPSSHCDDVLPVLRSIFRRWVRTADEPPVCKQQSKWDGCLVHQHLQKVRTKNTESIVWTDIEMCQTIGCTNTPAARNIGVREYVATIICSQFIFLAFIHIMNIDLIRRTFSVATRRLRSTES